MYGPEESDAARTGRGHLFTQRSVVVQGDWRGGGTVAGVGVGGVGVAVLPPVSVMKMSVSEGSP